MMDNLLNSCTYDVLRNSFFTNIILVSKMTSIVLAAIVAAFAYKFYKTYHSPILLGISLGFGFMSLTDVFIITILPKVNNLILFNLFFWLRLVTMSFAFTFLALAYYATSREGKRSNLLAIKYSALSTIPIFSIILSAWFFNNGNLPAFTQYDEYFSMYNICALGFVFIKILKRSVLKETKSSNSLLFAYGILWFGQISLLFCSLGLGSSNSINAFFAKDVGLAIFVVMQFNANKRKPILRYLKPQGGVEV